jgi:glutamine amidotransferase
MNATTQSCEPKVAIVDFGAGNLFSVAKACARAGLAGHITSNAADLASADAVLLPGVGAFGQAMARLREKGLVDALRHYARSGKPLVGICLGMQLFMTSSEEFGAHEGLGLIEGTVRRLPESAEMPGLKVPNIGWRRIHPATERDWSGTLLETVEPGSYLYLIHSYYTAPADRSVCIAETRYGNFTYCTAINKDNLWAFQFHPEKSADVGIGIYRSLARRLTGTTSITR